MRHELWQRRKHNPSPLVGAAAAGSRIDEGRANEGCEGAKGSHAIQPALVDSVPTPAPCSTVRAISPPCPFIRPIRPVQAAGSKQGHEADEADMSTEDDLEVVVKKTPATKRWARCVRPWSGVCYKPELHYAIGHMSRWDGAYPPLANGTKAVDLLQTDDKKVRSVI